MPEPYDLVQPTQPNVFDTSAGAYSSGVGALQFASNPFAINATMNQFMNPYIGQVVDDTVSRMRDRRDININQIQADANQASAFGGARHALLEAETLDRYGRAEDETVARLLQQGFDLSLGHAGNNLNRVAGAGANLVNASPIGYDLGARALGGQQTAGLQQQNLIQAILDQAGIQTENYINYPQQALGTALSGLQGNPLTAATTQTQVNSYRPGLFDYLGLGAGVGGAYLSGPGASK